MQVIVPTNNEAPVKCAGLRLTYEDLQRTGFLSTIGAANQRIIGYLPAGAAVCSATIQQVVDPAGATDLTIDVGTTSSDPDEYIDNADVDGITQCIWNTGEGFIGEAGTTDPLGVTNAIPNNTTAAIPVYMEFNGTHASLTAGEWIVVYYYMDPMVQSK